MVKINFTLDSFKQNISEGFSRLQQNEEFVDMTIAADDHIVKVHRNVLALASPYLRHLLQTLPANHPVIFLNNVKHEVLSYILEYIYTGEVEIHIEHLNLFLDAAKALHIAGAENMIYPKNPSSGSNIKAPTMKSNPSVPCTNSTQSSKPSLSLVANEPYPTTSTTSRVVNLSAQRIFSSTDITQSAAQTLSFSNVVQETLQLNSDSSAVIPVNENTYNWSQPTDFGNTNVGGSTTDSFAQSLSGPCPRDTYTTYTAQSDINSLSRNTVNATENLSAESNIKASTLNTNPTTVPCTFSTQSSIPSSSVVLNEPQPTTSRVINLLADRPSNSTDVSQSAGQSLSFNPVVQDSLQLNSDSSAVIPVNEITYNWSRPSDFGSTNLVGDSTIASFAPSLPGPCPGDANTTYTTQSDINTFSRSNVNITDIQYINTNPIVISSSNVSQDQSTFQLRNLIENQQLLKFRTPESRNNNSQIAANITLSNLNDNDFQLKVTQLPNSNVLNCEEMVAIDVGAIGVDQDANDAGQGAMDVDQDVNTAEEQQEGVLENSLDENIDVSHTVYSVSNRGSLQVISDNYIYNLHNQSQMSHRKRWRCIDYRRLQCSAFLDSVGDRLHKKNTAHIHPDHKTKILAKFRTGKIYNRIEEASKISEDEDDYESNKTLSKRRRKTKTKN